MFPRCHIDSKYSRKCVHHIINQAKIPYDIKTTPPINETNNELDPYKLFWRHKSFAWIHERNGNAKFNKFKKIIIHSLKLLHTQSRVLKNDLKQIVYNDNELTPKDVTKKLTAFFKHPHPRWVPNMLSV